MHSDIHFTGRSAGLITRSLLDHVLPTLSSNHVMYQLALRTPRRRRRAAPRQPASPPSLPHLVIRRGSAHSSSSLTPSSLTNTSCLPTWRKRASLRPPLLSASVPATALKITGTTCCSSHCDGMASVFDGLAIRTCINHSDELVTQAAVYSDKQRAV
jgi:hypothetical protein